MLAFRPFDTNGTAQQSYLGLSPPSKKSATTPSKDPIDKNLLYQPSSPDKQQSGFKFELQSVACISSTRAKKAAGQEGSTGWQDDLTSRISSFEKSYAERKAALTGTATPRRAPPVSRPGKRDLKGMSASDIYRLAQDMHKNR